MHYARKGGGCQKNSAPPSSHHFTRHSLTSPVDLRLSALDIHCACIFIGDSTFMQVHRMKPKKQAKKAVMEILKSSRGGKSTEELVELIQNSIISEKHVTKAIRKLEKKGQIQSSEGSYILNDEQRSFRGESNESGASDALPFAEILRRRAATHSVESPASKTEETQKVDVDDEIRRLEAELAADESDAVSDDGSESMQEDDDKVVSFGETTVTEIEGRHAETNTAVDGPVVVCLSSVAEERIAPLPANCLPQNKKRTIKGIDDDGQKPKKQKKSNVSNGLQEAVKEVLSGYVARSSERLPFYCRVCSKQYTNEQEFFDHRRTDFHKAAVEMERKASFCKLCRRQFTSPVQLKEHISSRPHKERLENARFRQRGGQTRDRRDDFQGQSRRQWC